MLEKACNLSLDTAFCLSVRFRSGRMCYRMTLRTEQRAYCSPAPTHRTRQTGNTLRSQIVFLRPSWISREHFRRRLDIPCVTVATF